MFRQYGLFFSNNMELKRTEIISENLANAQTTGFKYRFLAENNAEYIKIDTNIDETLIRSMNSLIASRKDNEAITLHCSKN